MNREAKRTFKDTVYGQFERVAKALANGRRLELLDLLAQGERNVKALAEETGMSVANTSQHLQILRASRIVEVHRDGLFARYRLADEQVFKVWRAIRELGEMRLAEIDRIVRVYLKDRQALEPVTVDELVRRLEENSVVVLDVRPEAEYRAGHIPGARSIPLDELEARLREIPKDPAIVAYCRGPYCVLSDEAVALLQANGYAARRLDQGYPDWRALGLPVEVSGRE